MPGIITAALVGSFCFGLISPIFLEVPSDVRQDILIGLGPLAGGAANYWLGSSKTQDRITDRQNSAALGTRTQE